MKLVNVCIVAALILDPSLGMAREEATPDMEMLEFLGGFETAGGKPVDPLVFAEYPATDTGKDQPDTEKKSRKRGRKSEKPEQKDRDNEY